MARVRPESLSTCARMSPERFIGPAWAVLALVLLVGALLGNRGPRQPGIPVSGPGWSAGDVIGPRACAECHEEEAAVWQESAHYHGSMSLTRDPLAQEIASALGVRRIKNDSRCTSCHFTVLVSETGREKAISGVSCESCHGPARNWVDLHDDLGGATSSAEEPRDHKLMRLRVSEQGGMNHVESVHGLAERCYSCHVIDDAALVAAGHPLGDGFELLPWLRGEVRHNFLRGNGNNADVSIDRRRVLFVVGELLDLEHALRGLARQGGLTGVFVARAREARDVLCRIHERQPIPQVRGILECSEPLTTEDASSSDLTIVADAVRKAAERFAEAYDGSELEAVDELIPLRTYYGNEDR